MTLFEINTTINFDKLGNMSFKDWKEFGNPLDLSNEETINDFYDLEYNESNPPYYHCLPIYNSVANDNAYRFLLIKKDTDTIFIAFKIISFMNVKRIKVMDKPISKERNVENEKETIKVLEKQDYIKFTYKKKYAPLYKGVGELSQQDFDYYIDFNEQSKKYTNKYMCKNHFNRFETNDFRYEFVNRMDLNKLFELRQNWEKTKLEQGVEITMKTNKFKKIISGLVAQPNTLFLNIYYKEQLVLNFCLIKYKNCFINLYRTSISRTNSVESNDSWIRNTLSRLDKYAIYVIINYLRLTYNTNYLYYGGSHPSNKTLANHKEMHSNGKITYLTHNGGRL